MQFFLIISIIHLLVLLMHANASYYPLKTHISETKLLYNSSRL